MLAASAKNIVVENRAGARGAIGIEGVKTAAADGYALAHRVDFAMTVIPAVRTKLR